MNISAEIEVTANPTTEVPYHSNWEVDSLKGVVFQNRMALDIITAPMGGVCALINTSCCTHIDEYGKIEVGVQKTWDHVEVLHQATQDDTPWGNECNFGTLHEANISAP